MENDVDGRICQFTYLRCDAFFGNSFDTQVVVEAHGVLFLLHGYISLASIQHHLMLMCCRFLRNYYFNHVKSYLLHTQYFSA